MPILVVEDDKLHRTYIRELITRHLSELGQPLEAENGEAALEVLEDHSPKYAILDLQMKGVNGVEIARRLWRRLPDARILFWSNYSDEQYVRSVTRIVPANAGYGYVLKSADEESLLFALRGVFVEDQCVIDRAVRGIQSRALDRREGLSDTEYETLFDIAVGLTDKAIARRRRISTRSVQSRLQGVYEKLVAYDTDAEPSTNRLFNPRSRLVCLAMMRGLINREILHREMAAAEAWLEGMNADEINRRGS